MDFWVPIGINGGAVGVLVIFVVAILRGRLVPRKQVDAMINVYKERTEDFKEANKLIDARNDELARQIGILVPLAEASVKALEAIRARANDKETAT